MFIQTQLTTKKCFNCLNRPVLYTQAPLLHDGAVSKAISDFKYNKKIKWGDFFAYILYRDCKTYIENFDIICPVPLHKSRLRQRGFNQSEEIAITLSKLSGKPIEHLLIRADKTHSQKGLGRKDRLLNLKNIFRPKSDANHQNILLLDDVTTTGSTLYECSKSIKNPGKIGGISVSRRI